MRVIDESKICKLNDYIAQFFSFFEYILQGVDWVNRREWIIIILLLMPLDKMLLLFYRMRKLNFRININHINIYISEPWKRIFILFCSKRKSWSPLRGDFVSISICVLFFKSLYTHLFHKQASSMTSCFAKIHIKSFI